MRLERLSRVVVDTAAAAVRSVAAFVSALSPYSESPLGLSERLPTSSMPPVHLWTRVRTEQYEAQVGGFLRRVVGVNDEEFYFNDGTTLEDIHPGCVDAYVQLTRQIYGVEISDIQPRYLWMIAKRIHEGPLAWPVKPPRPPRDSILADSEFPPFEEYADRFEHEPQLH